MTSIVYACVNEGVRKLVEYPPRVGTLMQPADNLQTVLATIPIGDQRQTEVEDDDYIYFCLSNGRHLVGVACRRPRGQHNLAGPEVQQVRQFLADTIKLAPSDTRVSLSQETLKQMQNMLKARLEASTDAKIGDVNAAIARARQEMESNIELTLARGDNLANLQNKSEAIGDSAGELQRKAEAVNSAMFWQRIKTAAVLVAAVVIIIIVLVMWICGPTLTACLGTASSTPAGAPTAAPSTGGGVTPVPIIHIG